MKIILLDSTDKWLSPIWRLGAWLYCALGWADDYLAGPDLEKLFTKLPVAEDIDEIQFWCHGWAGYICWNRHFLKSDFFKRPLTRSGGLLWFRSCSTIAGVSGRNFAKDVAETCQCKVAAHTYLIGQWGMQSGLRVYDPQEPSWDWPLEEGILEGPIEAPTKFESSGFFKPSTVSALTASIPKKRGKSWLQIP